MSTEKNENAPTRATDKTDRTGFVGFVSNQSKTVFKFRATEST